MPARYRLRHEQQTLGMHIDVSSSGPNGVSVHMYGSATNPYIKFLGPFAPSIHWDVNISLNTNPDGSETQYTVNGSRGNFPASEIDIDDQMITGGDVSIGGYKVSQGNIATSLRCPCAGPGRELTPTRDQHSKRKNFATIPAELYSKQKKKTRHRSGWLSVGCDVPATELHHGRNFLRIGRNGTKLGWDGKHVVRRPHHYRLVRRRWEQFYDQRTTTLQAVNGVADLQWPERRPSWRSLNTLIVTCNTLPSVTTDYFEVTPSAATQLVASAPTVPVLVNGSFGLDTQAEDQYGNVDPNFDMETATMLLLPGEAAPWRMLSVAAVSGEADFNDLTINNAGNGYTVQATSPGLTAGVSPTFNVSADQLVVTTRPEDLIRINSAFGLVVSAENAAGAVDTSFNGTMTVARMERQTELWGTLTVPAVNGIATFYMNDRQAWLWYTLTVTSSSVAAPVTTDSRTSPAGQLTTRRPDTPRNPCTTTKTTTRESLRVLIRSRSGSRGCGWKPGRVLQR